MMVRKRIFLVLLTAMFLLATGVFAADRRDVADNSIVPVDPNDPNDGAVEAGGLFDLPLEELMDMEVISVTRTQGQDVFTSPAAIYVITHEDIQRSGHRSIPELLRMVPGLYVARIDAGKWVVSSRNFSERFGRTLLVKVDGRTVYTPIFSGVFWESLDYILDDIERIEVIRGPGGSLWGANAFTGIINIITKDSRDTQGGLVQGGAGNEEKGFGSLRYGGKLSENSFYRIYAMEKETDSSKTFGNPGFTDDQGAFQTGFRTDFGISNSDNLTFQGDWHFDRAGNGIRVADISAGTNPLVNTDIDTYNWNMLGRWSREISEDSRMSLQMYFDRSKRDVDSSEANFREKYETFDIDFQHSFFTDESNQLVWGLGFKRIQTAVNNIDKIQFNPDSRILHTFSGFVQSSFEIDSESKLTVGTKLENNDLTDFEFQPRASYVWTPDDKNTVWVAVSRALRIPSLTNYDETIVLDVVAPGSISEILPNRDFDPEELIAYEVGYRAIPNEKLSFDMACFLNQFDKLETLKQVDADTFQWDNGQDGYSYGTELLINWRPTDKLKLIPSYTFLKMDLEGVDDSETAGRTPENQFQIRAYYNVTDKLALNGAIYYYDNNRTEDVPAFVRTDIGLIWQPTKDLEIGAWGQNIFDNDHQEFGPDRFFSTGGGFIQRSLYVNLKYKF
ncbi:MAG: TonB-dependent receptor [Phycisphaerae bacterium]|nr:TonB-dependent receptor [Phycisphaerae bacterium]